MVTAVGQERRHIDDPPYSDNNLFLNGLDEKRYPARYLRDGSLTELARDEPATGRLWFGCLRWGVNALSGVGDGVGELHLAVCGRFGEVAPTAHR